MSGSSIEAAIAATLDRHTGRVVVGFSGGLDSTVVLYGAASVVSCDRLIAMHVNHGLNASAEAWQRHCQLVSADLGVQFVCAAVHVARSGSLEASARRARYAAFAEYLETDDLLLLGHHLDDQAETVLLRLLRGGATAGMPVRRRIGRGELARPLLEHPRSRLQTWARARDLRWIEDDSNADVRFERNYLRHEVLPALSRQWPDVAGRLARAAGKFAEESAALQRLLDGTLDAGGATATTIAIEVLARSDAVALLLRRWLERAGVIRVRARVIEQIVRQMDSALDRTPVIVVAPGISVRRYADRLHLVPQADGVAAPLVWALGAELVFGSGRLTATRGPAGLCGNTTHVVVRPRRGGERLGLPGGRGSRSVKRLLQEARVPPWHREHFPLLYVGERLAAVPGIAVDAAFVDAGTCGWRIEWNAGTL